MSEDIKHNIFQVIKKLRSQKARPDIFRISHRLEKLHGVPKERTQNELDRLVSELKLCRVDSKGNHSYRIIADSLPDGSSENSMSELLVMALNELTAPELKGRKNQKQNVTIKELRKQIYKDNNPRNIRFLPQNSPIWTTILDNLHARGTVQLHANGKYSLTSFSASSNTQQSSKNQSGDSKPVSNSPPPTIVKENNRQSKTPPPAKSPQSDTSDPTESVTTALHDEDTPLSLVAGISANREQTDDNNNDSDEEDSRPIALLASNATSSSRLTPTAGLTPSVLTPATAPDVPVIKQETVAVDASVVCLSPSLPGDLLVTGNQELGIQGSKSAITSEIIQSPVAQQRSTAEHTLDVHSENISSPTPKQHQPADSIPLCDTIIPIKIRGKKRKRNELPYSTTTSIIKSGSLVKKQSDYVTRSSSPRSPSLESNKRSKVIKDTTGVKRTRRSTTSSPSDHPPKINSTPPTCDFCLLPAKRSSDVLDCLLSCSDCQAKAHPSCMHYSQELANHAKLTKWQCIDCKVCCICLDDREVASMQGDEMLFCDSCDKGYHMNCHFPIVESKPKGNWQCSKCYENCKSTNATDYGIVYEVAYSHYPKFENKENMPNASAWQVDDVYRFLAEKGFEQQAIEFKKQEIDGPSLLLMKRQDVLNSLSLRLGPALKIYYHIECLQRVALRHYNSMSYSNKDVL